MKTTEKTKALGNNTDVLEQEPPTEAPATAPDFKLVPLDEIDPDPNQPRQFYDEAAEQELTDSVRMKGVLQPILIRPKNGRYMVVFGERRYRASKAVQVAFKSRNTIPAIIRDLSDEEALELQIIENLQRQDIHPMEEAVSFKSLIDRKVNAMTVEEIAARVGKKPQFVRQRLKLNSLTKQWQEAFFKDIIGLYEALKIAMLAEAMQNELYKNEQIAEHVKQKRQASISEYDLSKYRGNLATAPFDITDPNLSPKFGACTTCPYNSAVGKLFPGDEKNPVCTNVKDFVYKSDRAFEIKFKQAKEDPGWVLISTDYYISDDERKKYEKDGQKVYNSHEWQSVGGLEKPDWIEFCEENDEWDDDKKQKEFDKLMTEYNSKMAEFQEKIDSGKYLKGLVVIGHGKRGQVMYVKLSPKKETSGKSKALKAKDTADITPADIDEELRRINEREKRNEELDLNKIHIATLQELDKKKPAAKALKHQGAVDRALIAYVLIECAGYQAAKEIQSKTGFEKTRSKRGYDYEHFKKLEKITDDQFAFIARTIIFEKWGHVNFQGDVNTDDTTIRLIAQYAGVDLKAIEKTQAEAAKKRKDNVAARKQTLLNKKKALQSNTPAKKAAEKPSPKKAAPKKASKKSATKNAKKAAKK